MKTAILAVLCLPTPHAFATHTLSFSQPPKYPAGFKAFDYASPDVPRGETLTLPAQGGFDTLNLFTLKGDHEVGATTLTLDILMEKSLDGLFTMYGPLVEDVASASDGLSATFRLNPKAKFHSGDPALTGDVAYSFKALTQDKATVSMYKFYQADMAVVKTPAPRTAAFRFKKRNAELRMILGGPSVFSHRNFPKGLGAAANTLPAGSGPYRFVKAESGHLSEFVCDKDYWARNLSAGRGRYNFNVVRFRYFRGDSMCIEGIEGGQYDFIQKNTACNWARAYPADMLRKRDPSKHGRIRHSVAGVRGFVMDTRRKPLDDIRVWRAIVESSDFDNVNSRLFCSTYRRSNSFFTDSDTTAFGKPSGRESAPLEPLRAQLPAIVFTGNMPKPPKTDSKTGVRSQPLKARALLEQVGYRYRNDRLKSRQGRPLTFEFLSPNKTYEHVVAKWQRDLVKIGVGMTVRLADLAVYQRRINGLDFNTAITVYASSGSPGNKQFDYFSCASAKTNSSRSLAGVCGPAVETLLKGFGRFENRHEQVTSARALDRVIRHQCIIAPNWPSDRYRMVYRDTLGIPKTLPRYYSPVAWTVGAGWKK